MDYTYIANPVEVTAKRIKKVTYDPAGGDYRWTLVLEDETVFSPTEGQTARMEPQIGDYVVTQSDGYTYLNPKDVFERKYRKRSDKPKEGRCHEAEGKV